MGELARRLLDPFVPAGHVMDQHHAGPRPAAERARVVGFADVAFVAARGDRFRKHAFVGHAVTRCIVDPMAMPPAQLYMPPAGALAQKRYPPERGRPCKKAGVAQSGHLWSTAL